MRVLPSLSAMDIRFGAVLRLQTHGGRESQPFAPRNGCLHEVSAMTNGIEIEKIVDPGLMKCFHRLDSRRFFSLAM